MIAYNDSKLKLNIVDRHQEFLWNKKQRTMNINKEKGGVLLVIIQIYQRFTLITYGKEIYPQRSLPKGSTL